LEVKRLNQLNPQRLTDREGRTMQGVEGYAGFARIKKKVELRPACLHRARHGAFGEAPRLHLPGELRRKHRLDRPRRNLGPNTGFIEPAFDG
jgi:hypothetical protein